MYDRKAMQQILTENNISHAHHDPNDHLAELVRGLGIDPPLLSSAKKAPALHIKKDASVSDLDEVRKGLEQQGYEIPTKEELDREREAIKMTQNGEIAEAMKLFAETISSSFIQMQEQQREKKSSPLINGAELIVQEEFNIMEKINAEPKIHSMAIPIQRNSLKQSVMDKEYLTDNKGNFIRQNGQYVVTEYYQVKINGHKFKYPLGSDNGIRQMVYIYNVPWSVAKIIANATNQTIQNPATGEMFVPDSLPIPAHEAAIDGETGQILDGVSGISNVYKDVMRGQFPFQQMQTGVV